MSEIKLLPCPFCCSTNIEVGYFRVQCMDCRVGTEDGHPIDEAIAEWNTRKPMERIVERLEEEKYKEMLGGWETMRIDRAIEIVKEEGGLDE